MQEWLEDIRQWFAERSVQGDTPHGHGHEGHSGLADDTLGGHHEPLSSEVP